MSRDPVPSSKSTPTSTATTTHASDAHELARLDVACNRITRAVPDSPYTLSVPVHVEPRYHYPSRQEGESWQRNTPFYLHEEGLQYITNVLREPGDGLFVVRSKVDEEREAAAAAAAAAEAETASKHLRNGSLESVATTRPSTPLPAGLKLEKKKISLSDYKDKVAGGKGEKKSKNKIKDEGEEQEHQHQHQHHRLFVEKEDKGVLKTELDAKKQQVTSVNGELKMANEAMLKDATRVLTPGTKRSRDPDPTSTKSVDKPASFKKARLSPSRPASPKPASTSTSTWRSKSKSAPSLQPSLLDGSGGPPHGLPPLLSPPFPFEGSGTENRSSQPLIRASKPATSKEKNKSSNWNLPDMLSPTLPPKIEAELVQEQVRGRLESNQSSPGSSQQSPMVKARQAAANMDESQPGKVKDGTKLRRTAQEPEIDEEDEDDEARILKKHKLWPVVRLKYSKKIAYRIKALLRIPPQANRKKFPLDEAYLLERRNKAAAERAEPPKAERPVSKSVAELSSSQKTRPRASSAASATSAAESPIVRPKKEPPPSSSQDARRNQRDRLHPDMAKTSARVTEKRPRQDDVETTPSDKKQKLGPSSLDLKKARDPSTPIASAIPSPSTQRSGGSIKESITVTPKSHLKAIALTRNNSQESIVATPNGKPLSSTPHTSSRPVGRAPTSNPTAVATGPRAKELQALIDQSQKYNALGRKLKHENQAITSSPTGGKTEPEKKRLALLGLECIMSYMLAYSLGDARRKIEGRSAELESSWKTLIPLFKHMGRFAAPYRPLEGLWAYLGITINARISLVAGDRVVRSANLPLATDSPQSTSASISDAQTSENMKTHFEAVRDMTEHSRLAAEKLSVEELMTSFQRVYERRATGLRGPALESMLDEKSREVRLSGQFWVPVGIDSAPVQAVRFAVEVLREWIRGVENGYEPRIKI